MSIKITIFSVNDWLGSRLSGKKAVVRWDAEKSQAGQGLCPRGGSVLAFSLPGDREPLVRILGYTSTYYNFPYTIFAIYIYYFSLGSPI